MRDKYTAKWGVQMAGIIFKHALVVCFLLSYHFMHIRESTFR
ncbi:DUF6783 domain-containing protein [uncultured Robinsoniella sp.]